MPVKVLRVHPDDECVTNGRYLGNLQYAINAHEDTHIFWGTLLDPDGNLLVVLSEKQSCPQCNSQFDQCKCGKIY